VMSFTFRLHRLPHDGMLLCGHRVHMPFWPLPDRKALLDHYDTTTRDAPDQYVANLVLTKVMTRGLDGRLGPDKTGALINSCQ
jgi:hypothetical protein